MAGLSYSDLVTQIRNYTETDSNVLTTAILENIILNSQYRIMRDVPIDADRKQQSGSLVTGQESINAPAGALFIRGIQVYDSTSSIAGANTWLEKKDVTYLQEYVSSTESAKRGKPKYYSMYGGATGNTDTTSGRMFLAPVPDSTYKFRVHYNKMPWHWFICATTTIATSIYIYDSTAKKHEQYMPDKLTKLYLI